MTQREVLALCTGLVLIALGWTMETDGEREGSAVVDTDVRSGAEGNSVAQSQGGGTESGLFAGVEPEVGPGLAGRVEAELEAGTTLGGASSPRVASTSAPSIEPSAWPAHGLFVRVTTAEGAVAVGAPIGVWVLGGRSPLALLESDAEGRVHFVGVPALAARYEVGLAAPGVQRVAWPMEVSSASTDDGADVGLERASPLMLVLPRCGTLEVHVVRASRTGTRVELGQGTAESFQVAQVRAAEADGVARFAWLPLGLELTLRVPFAEGTIETAVAGPDDLQVVGVKPATALVPATRRVRIGPEGLLEG